MPLWGNKDNAANSDIAATMYVNKATTSANQTALYGNTEIGKFFANLAVGQFAVDTNEMNAANTGRAKPAHSGWVLRKEGTGGRAGRVTYEVLVATGSIATDGSDDTQFPDFRITLTGPSSNSAQTGNVSLAATAVSVPAGATLSYNWQRYNGGSWVNIPNTAGVWFNNTSPTLLANVAVANANTVRVQVSATGANTVISGNATITLLP